MGMTLGLLAATRPTGQGKPRGTGAKQKSEMKKERNKGSTRVRPGGTDSRLLQVP